MKYIRTKDGVFEKTEWQCDLTGEMILVKANNKFGNDGVFARDIIKQADTIEKLCDCIVIQEYGFGHPFLPYYARPLKELSDDWRKDIKLGLVEWIKYAIWTDKGLIYVAKMSEKGELELL